jgi:hypothetical protein
MPSPFISICHLCAAYQSLNAPGEGRFTIKKADSLTGLQKQRHYRADGLMVE